MLYIFWWILNLFLAAGFLVICFNAAKLVKVKYGLFVTVIFVFGLFSFVSNPSNDEESKTPVKTLRFHDERSSLSFQEDAGTWSIPDTIARHYIFKDQRKLIIHNNPLFKVWLHISYGQETVSGRIEPLYSYTSVEGMLSGIKWKPIAPLLNTDESGKRINYDVNGEMNWRLLNMTVCSEGKNFTGSIDIND